MNEHAPAPAVLDGLAGVPEPFARVLDLLDKDDVVTPGNPGHGLRKAALGNLSHKLWDNFGSVLVRQVEGAHPVEVCPREAAQPGERLLEVFAQAVEHRVTPAVAFLACDDVSPDLPVERDELPVDSERRSKLSGADPFLDLTEERLVALGREVGFGFRVGGLLAGFFLAIGSVLLDGFTVGACMRFCPPCPGLMILA